jgi:hypothetical protein
MERRAAEMGMRGKLRYLFPSVGHPTTLTAADARNWSELVSIAGGHGTFDALRGNSTDNNNSNSLVLDIHTPPGPPAHAYTVCKVGPGSSFPLAGGPGKSAEKYKQQ